MRRYSPGVPDEPEDYSELGSQRDPQPEPEPEPLAPPRELRIASWILVAQALGLLGAAAVLVDKTITGHPHSVPLALSDIGLALLGAAVLGLSTRGILQGRSSARTPVVLMELLAMPVGYSLAFQAGLVIYGGPILLSAVAVLYLLFTPAARARLDRDV